MATQINYQLSLKNRKISFSRGIGDRLFTHFIQVSHLIVAGSISYFLLSEAFNGSSSISYQQSAMLITGILWSVLVFMYIRRAQISRFRELRGMSLSANKHNVQKILRCLKWRTTEQGENYVIAHVDSHVFHWGRQIAVLFEGNRILINCATMRSDRTPSSLFPLGDLMAYQEFLHLWHRLEKRS